MKKYFKLSIVTPVFNEEEIIGDFYHKLISSVGEYNYEIVFVDDGSTDKSLFILKRLQKNDNNIKIIQFDKNYGQQSAIVAGLRNISGDIAVVMDSDLQDNPNYISDMLKKWESGSKVVFAKREEREDKTIKRINAYVFYRLLKLLAPETQLDTGDYYLLDKSVISKIRFSGKRIYLRGQIAMIEKNTDYIEVKRNKRNKGYTKYTYKKMIRLALDAFLTSRVSLEKRKEEKPYKIERTFGFDKEKICIMGGGISGLALAYYLSCLEYKVTILEKSFEIGGLLRTVKTTKGYKIEKYYHHIFKTDTDLITLLEDLDILDKLKWYKISTSLYQNNKFYPFTSPIDLLKSPLSLITSLRIGLTTIYLGKINSKKYKNITAKELIKRCMGAEAWDKLWKPLFEGKFESYSGKVGAPWFVSRLNLKSSSKRSDNEHLGYLDGSFQVLLDGLKEELAKNGVKILTDQNIDTIKNEKKGFIVDGDPYDVVVSTIQPKSFAKISPLSRAEKKKYENIEYIGAICALIELNKKQTDYYWNNILDINIPFKGLIEHTNFIDPEKYGENTIVYLGQYTKTNSKHFQMSKEELEDKYMKNLEKMIPGIKKDILSFNIFKSKEAQPVISAGFEPLNNKTSISNLYITSMAHIYPEDRGINNAIREAKKIVNLIEVNN